MNESLNKFENKIKQDIMTARKRNQQAIEIGMFYKAETSTSTEMLYKI